MAGKDRLLLKEIIGRMEVEQVKEITLEEAYKQYEENGQEYVIEDGVCRPVGKEEA